MNLLEYVKENTEGLVFIDGLRKVIKDLCSKGIKEEFEDVTDEDVDKMSLMLECNFFTGVTSEDSEWDLNTIKVDEAQFLINSNIGLFALMRGIEKNRRESYTEILWDVFYELNNLLEDEVLIESSELITRVYETIDNIEAGEYGYTYDMISNEDLDGCLSDIYKLIIQDKIEI